MDATIVSEVIRYTVVGIVVLAIVAFIVLKIKDHHNHKGK